MGVESGMSLSRNAQCSLSRESYSIFFCRLLLRRMRARARAHILRYRARASAQVKQVIVYARRKAAAGSASGFIHGRDIAAMVCPWHVAR
jgi:hypothetical protein